MKKYCHVYKGTYYVNTVTYQKDYGHWRAVYQLPDRLAVVTLTMGVNVHKQELVKEGYTWVWSDEPVPPDGDRA